jgi:kynurenine formamidase
MENLYLEKLSEDRAYEFLFIGLPLKFKGATGSPFRPIAVLVP